MRLKRIFLCLVILSASVKNVLGQVPEIKFDSIGRLTQIDFKPGYKKGPFFGAHYYRVAKSSNLICDTSYNQGTKDFILKALETFDSSQKVRYRKGLSKNIKKTLDALDNNEINLRPFLDSLWGITETSNYIDSLKNLQKILDAPDTSNFTLAAYFKEIITPLNNNLKTKDSTNSYFIPLFTGNKLELWRTDVFNRFVIQYYNATYASAPNALKRLSLTEILINKKRFAFFVNKADSLLKLVQKNIVNDSVKIEWEHFTAMRDFIDELAKPNPGFRLERRPYTFEEMKTLFNDKWFKQWLWFKSGSISINPLAFTTEQNFQISAEDWELTEMSNRYVDSMLARHLRFDTAANIERYDKLLLQKGRAKERFSTSDKVKEQINTNNTEMDKLLITSRLLNKVQIPEKAMFVSFSSYDGFIDKTAGKYFNKYLTFSLREEDKKTIALHNIPKGYKGKLIEENKLIPLRSNFMIGLDTAIGYAAQVFGFAAQFSPYVYILPQLNVSQEVIKKIIAPRDRPAAFTEGRGDGNQTYLQRLKSKIDDNKIYDNIAFNTTVKIIEARFGNHAIFQTTITPIELFDNKATIIPFFDSCFAEYQRQIEKRKKDVFSEVRKDSLLLSGMYTIFNEATLLPKNLEEKSDDTPAFFTSILSTSPSDSSIEKKVTPIAYGKDTLTAKSFKYKAGKSMNWQLGAGLAYTATNFIQTTATEENGQIKIENKSQAYRFIVGVHYHFGKGLFVHDNRFGGRFIERSSVYLGVGIPKPLENVYFGYAYDLVPGLKLTFGLHFYRNDAYTILNNSIIEKRLRYNIAFPFFAVQIDPTSLLKTFNIIKK